MPRGWGVNEMIYIQVRLPMPAERNMMLSMYQFHVRLAAPTDAEVECEGPPTTSYLAYPSPRENGSILLTK